MTQAIDVAVGPSSMRRGRLANTPRTLLRFARKQPIGAASAVIIIVMCILAIFANQIAPYSATKNDVAEALIGPSPDHWFGSDQFGRDVWSRVIHGSYVSLKIGVVSTLASVALATLLGAVSGYFGSLFDYLLQRVVDAAQAVPALVTLIAISLILDPGTNTVIIALSLRGGLVLSRVVRGAVIGIRNNVYIEAARAIGASHARIIASYIVPNVFPTIVVLFSTLIGANILAESQLSFLGLGVRPPEPSWGGMASSEGRGAMLVQPWILITPTVALALVVFSANMFGDALRDELDPRLRGSR